MMAIITGASSGIGAEFCRALDDLGLDSLWIVARRADRLEDLAASLETPCKVITADLSTSEGLRTLEDAVVAEKADIGYLVNCAGFGRFGRTWEVSAEDTRMMIDLNIGALTEITRFCIPHMRSGSHIVEVCSASAYLPLEQLNVYSATKAYVKAFCDALRKELRDSDISVLEVSPGWVSTDFIAISREGRSVSNGVFKHTVTAEQVVSVAMSDLSKGKKRSICGSYNKFQTFVCSHFPRIASLFWMRSLS